MNGYDSSLSFSDVLHFGKSIDEIGRGTALARRQHLDITESIGSFSTARLA